MAQYRDTAGQVHTLRITLAHRRPIIDATEWDLLELAHKPERLDAFLKALAEDDDLIWALLGQIEGRTPDELMAVADGTTHEDASAALLESIADFFPARSPLRAPMLELLERTRAAQQAATDVIEGQLLQAVRGWPTSSVESSAAVPMSG